MLARQRIIVFHIVDIWGLWSALHSPFSLTKGPFSLKSSAPTECKGSSFMSLDLCWDEYLAILKIYSPSRPSSTDCKALHVKFRPCTKCHILSRIFIRTSRIQSQSSIFCGSIFWPIAGQWLNIFYRPSGPSNLLTLMPIYLCVAHWIRWPKGMLRCINQDTMMMVVSALDFRQGQDIKESLELKKNRRSTCLFASGFSDCIWLE